MTKEEAIRFLKRDHCWKGVPPDTQMAIETLMQQPSLPSNVDEAALQFARRAYSPFDDPYEVSKAFENDVNCFKAGAEWVAEQFQKIEGELVDWYETGGVDYCHGISTNESFEVPEGFYIRKK